MNAILSFTNFNGLVNFAIKACGAARRYISVSVRLNCTSGLLGGIDIYFQLSKIICHVVEIHLT